MEEGDLRRAIHERLPGLDKILERESVPIHDRILRAAFLFMEVAVEASEPPKEELIGSELFRTSIIPIFSDWYWEKYGRLCRIQRDRTLSGILASFAQPLRIKFPQTLSRPGIEGETAWLSFPDTLRDGESIDEMLGNVVRLERLEAGAATTLKAEASTVVGFSRSINLNLMTIDRLDRKAFSMARTIWPHFEKAVADLLALTPEGAATACWDLHLAIEKSLKVLIRSKNPALNPFGHDLEILHKTAADCGCVGIDVALVKQLPKDKKAIEMRYAETLVDISMAVRHYKVALELTCQITRCLPRKFKINNGAILIRMAPWAR